MSDFGLVKLLGKEGELEFYTRSIVGTPNYMAPEVYFVFWKNNVLVCRCGPTTEATLWQQMCGRLAASWCFGKSQTQFVMNWTLVFQQYSKLLIKTVYWLRCNRGRHLFTVTKHDLRLKVIFFALNNVFTLTSETVNDTGWFFLTGPPLNLLSVDR